MFVNGSELNEHLYRRPPIVSVHLAEGFQRRRLKCEKLTDDRHQGMAKAHNAFDILSKPCKSSKHNT